jgi:ABC-type branched-subunit amino acid transport system substrate-binding protein
MGYEKTPGKVKLATIAENVAGGIIAKNAIAGMARAIGAKVVYQQAPIPILGTTTYAPFAQAVISSGANAVYEVLDAPDSIGLAAALKSDGYKGTVVNGVTYFPGELASQPNEAAALNGVYVEDEFPANENETAATKQEQKDLTSIGQKPDLTSGISVGYWSAIVFEQILKATLQKVGGNPNKVTGATIAQTVNGGWTYRDPIAGGIGTETFPAAQKIPTGCGTFLKTVGTTFEEIKPYQCEGTINTKTKQVISQTTGKPTGAYKVPS